ncbi:hypothetical protein ACIQPR_33625 [Streptomyces sp. NPDC091280]|uniref:hypothetical protein n=1 Tax=Streptomyces sp. NPDC091280 TaxID=3365984 RepID=UPI0038058145
MAKSLTVRHITPGATVPPRRSRVPASATRTAAGREGAPLSAVDHVADFYGAYTDALRDRGRGQLAEALRHHYLTPDLRRRLISWEAVHARDGVLRSTDVPTSWRVDYDNSGTGHCWSRVTLVREDGDGQPRRTHLVVRSDLATRRISDIRTGVAGPVRGSRERPAPPSRT